MAYSCQANAVLAEVSSNFFCHHSLSLRLRLLLYRILFIYHSLTPSATFSLYDPLSLHVTLNLTSSTSGKLRRGSRCLPVREAPGHRLPGLTTLETQSCPHQHRLPARRRPARLRLLRRHARQASSRRSPTWTCHGSRSLCVVGVPAIARHDQPQVGDMRWHRESFGPLDTWTGITSDLTGSVSLAMWKRLSDLSSSLRA